MKCALAIVCSLVLMGTLFLSAQPAPCAKPMTRACCHGGKTMSCCKSHSQPAPAVPAQNNAQNQVSLFAPAAMIWTLPLNPAASVCFVDSLPSFTSGVPLYSRNCALLL